ncbi:MAG: hypothetical protein OJF47_000656 [Nitrospira sp.]|nr:MAG: hypothetical protein OJF47_000656 [Nitrospira sp.]
MIIEQGDAQQLVRHQRTASTGSPCLYDFLTQLTMFGGLDSAVTLN